MAAYTQFVDADQRFVAAGKTTNEAASFYRRRSIDWVHYWATLAQLGQGGVTISGETVTVWMRPEDVTVGSTGNYVVLLRRWVDASALVVKQDGREVEQPNLQKPHVLHIRLERRQSETWWRVGSPRQCKPC
ncbi:hypothetical protein [Nocardioides sp.]|uniref:hypothetical protein n=1 Tax=Nocardioides sp. TaxID=35761 RepID=UPI003D0B2E26